MVLLMLCLHRSRPGFGTGSMHQPPSPEDFKSKSSLATIHCVLLLLGVRKCMNLSWYGQDQILTYTSAPSQLPASHAIHTWPVIDHSSICHSTKKCLPQQKNQNSLTRISQSVFFKWFWGWEKMFLQELKSCKVSPLHGQCIFLRTASSKQWQALFALEIRKPSIMSVTIAVQGSITSIPEIKMFS